jgi:hypothetical protein
MHHLTIRLRWPRLRPHLLLAALLAFGSPLARAQDPAKPDDKPAAEKKDDKPAAKPDDKPAPRPDDKPAQPAVPGLEGPAVARPKPPAEMRPATVNVILPQEGRVWVWDQTRPVAAATAAPFALPPLEVGKNYDVFVTVALRQPNGLLVTRGRRLTVTAGQTLVADFTAPSKDDERFPLVPTDKTEEAFRLLTTQVALSNIDPRKIVLNLDNVKKILGGEPALVSFWPAQIVPDPQLVDDPREPGRKTIVVQPVESKPQPRLAVWYTEQWEIVVPFDRGGYVEPTPRLRWRLGDGR